MANHLPEPEDMALMTPLLEGADEGDYLVVPIDVLAFHLRAAYADTRRKRQLRYRAEYDQALTRTMLALAQLGYVHHHQVDVDDEADQ